VSQPRESRRALVVVDVQNGFTEDSGELPVAGGDATARAIGAFVAGHRDAYDLVVTTQDWHIDPGAHFAPESPDFVDTWPAHCRAGTPGAELDPLLTEGAGRPFLELVDVGVRKGAHAAAYSGFQGVTEDGRPLAQVLRDAGITDVDYVGIALSHCVKETALDGVREGFAGRVLRDLTVHVSPESGVAALEALRAAGVEILGGEPVRAGATPAA
jgi:nicotinamidase/pyrazinamidase